MNLQERNQENIRTMLNNAISYWSAKPSQQELADIIEIFSFKPKLVIENTFKALRIESQYWPKVKKWNEESEKQALKLKNNHKLQEKKILYTEQQIQNKIEQLEHTSLWSDICKKITTIFNSKTKIQPLKLKDNVVVLVEDKAILWEVKRNQSKIKKLNFNVYFLARVKEESGTLCHYCNVKDITRFGYMPFYNVPKFFKLS